MSFANKVVFVTGSSRGIGAAIARAFARSGARVAVHGRDQAALDAVAREIQQNGGDVMSVQGDVTRSEDIERMRATVEHEWAPVNILIANAGANLTPPAPLEDIPEEGWRATVDANLLATFLTLKAFLPGMKKRREGVIITISSAAGRRASARSPIAYSAAKSGIALMTQDVAAQAGPYGIRANCIAPETILTERNKDQIPEPVQQSLIDAHPLQQLGTPEDVAGAALFLASDDARWITGIVLDVAGGAVMP
jgi:3-oxoacyl-[acyl-carrier protein] reductase